MIPGMDKSSANLTPVVKPPLEKKRELKRENDFNYRSVIGSLNFLNNPTRPEDQFAVHPCTRFSADTKLPYDQSVKRVLKYLKDTTTRGLIMKPDPEKGIECYMDNNFSCG